VVTTGRAGDRKEGAVIVVVGVVGVVGVGVVGVV